MHTRHYFTYVVFLLFSSWAWGAANCYVGDTLGVGTTSCVLQPPGTSSGSGVGTAGASTGFSGNTTGPYPEPPVSICYGSNGVPLPPGVLTPYCAGITCLIWDSFSGLCVVQEIIFFNEPPTGGPIIPIIPPKPQMNCVQQGGNIPSLPSPVPASNSPVYHYAKTTVALFNAGLIAFDEVVPIQCPKSGSCSPCPPPPPVVGGCLTGPAPNVMSACTAPPGATVVGGYTYCAWPCCGCANDSAAHMCENFACTCQNPYPDCSCFGCGGGVRTCDFGCFSRDTMVLMGDGKTLRKIDNIVQGDQVYNPKIKGPVTVYKTVAGDEKEKMYEVELPQGGKLKVTRQHPMTSRRGLIQASELKVGDVLKDGKGKWQKVLKITKYDPNPMDPVVWNMRLDRPNSPDRFHYLIANGYVTGDYDLQIRLAKRRGEKIPKLVTQVMESDWIWFKKSQEEKFVNTLLDLAHPEKVVQRQKK